MIFSIDPSACVACLACVRVCPTGAVEVQEPIVRIEDDRVVLDPRTLPESADAAVGEAMVAALAES